MLTTNQPNTVGKKRITEQVFVTSFEEVPWSKLLNFFETHHIEPDYLNMVWRTKTYFESIIFNSEWASLDYLISEGIINSTHFKNYESILLRLIEKNQWEFLHIFCKKGFITEDLIHSYLSDSNLQEYYQYLYKDIVSPEFEIVILLGLSDLYLPETISNIITDYLKLPHQTPRTKQALSLKIEAYRITFVESLITESIKYYELNFDYEKSLLGSQYLKILPTLLKDALMSIPFLLMTENFGALFIVLMAELGINGKRMNRESVANLVKKAAHMHSILPLDIYQVLNDNQKMSLGKIDKLIPKLGFFKDFKPIEKAGKIEYHLNYRPA